jgi:hypothetical protein
MGMLGCMSCVLVGPTALETGREREQSCALVGRALRGRTVHHPDVDVYTMVLSSSRDSYAIWIRDD